MTSNALPWLQYNIELDGGRAATDELAVEHLGPIMAAADAGAVAAWWLMRKRPVRLRCQLADPHSTFVTHLLDQFACDGYITSWARGIYEPENAAFGGDQAMAAAHQLFSADTAHVLRYAARQQLATLGRTEVYLLLCAAFLRAAGLDWFEQGDVWERVYQQRDRGPANLPADPARLDELTAQVRTLLTVDTRALAAQGKPLDGYAPWVTAYEQTGQTLAHLNNHGRLRRGLRAVLAHHVIFTANRHGIALPDHAAVTRLALSTVFGPAYQAPSTTSKETSTMLTTGDQPTATELRNTLTDNLVAAGTIHTAAIEDAFRAVPRDRFLPGVDRTAAYVDDAVYTKTDAGGERISAASQPTIVARMLEQLAPQAGELILEAGAGTGYNAALMATIVGETGHVTTIDVDADLVEDARGHLRAAEIGNVEVILGDGALGYPGKAPFDAVIATVGAFEVPLAWREQLTPTGRIVVPLRLRGAASRSIAFTRDSETWISTSSALTTFMPLRASMDDARRQVPLTADGDVVLHVNKDQNVDPAELGDILAGPRSKVWTDVYFGPMVSFEYMDLWLACTLPGAILRMNVQATAKQRDLVTPMFDWGAMATVTGPDLAYLTLRSAADNPGTYEVGVIGHGPDGASLAHVVAEQIRVWDKTFRQRRVDFALRTATGQADPAAGRFVLPRSDHSILVTWS